MIGSPEGLKHMFKKKGPCFNGSAWSTQAAHHTDYLTIISSCFFSIPCWTHKNKKSHRSDRESRRFETQEVGGSPVLLGHHRHYTH